MNRIAFLYDECMPTAPLRGLRESEPAISVQRVGEPGAPPLGTLDPEILMFAEEHQLTLISQDKKSMPKHVTDHHSLGRHTWGIRIVKKAPVKDVVSELIRLWMVHSPEDLLDSYTTIPDGKKR